MKVVIMAGGKGTRIASVNSLVPKPMIPLLDKPVLLYQVESLKKQGFTDFIFIIGYMGECIERYFGSGTAFGVNIQYVKEEEPLGTAGALFFLKDQIKDDFLLLNGDILFDIDIKRFYASHKKYGGIATIFTHPNSHPYDSGIIVGDHGIVNNWLHKEEKRLWYKNRVNAGLHFLSPLVFDAFSKAQKTDLDRDILKPLIKEKKLFFYDSPEYVMDMGTPERYEQVKKDMMSGKVERKNLKNKQKAVFLDRDGTLNKYVGFLTNPDQLELLLGAAEAVKRINESGYLAIVATNQPVIARGDVTFEELDEINNKLETLLGKEGAYLDKIYFCPHHPEKGFEGERPEFKIVCDCRKPKAGMLFKAAEELNIDLSASYMIGDRESDVLCGKNAGCKTAIIGKNQMADFCGDSLLECIQKIGL